MMMMIRTFLNSEGRLTKIKQMQKKQIKAKHSI